MPRNLNSPPYAPNATRILVWDENGDESYKNEADLPGGGSGITPNLQAVTDVGGTTTNPIEAEKVGVYDELNEKHEYVAGADGGIQFEDENGDVYFTSDYQGIGIGKNIENKKISINNNLLTQNRLLEAPDGDGIIARLSDIPEATGGTVTNVLGVSGEIVVTNGSTTPLVGIDPDYDADLLHKTGNETKDGDLTINGNTKFNGVTTLFTNNAPPAFDGNFKILGAYFNPSDPNDPNNGKLAYSFANQLPIPYRVQNNMQPGLNGDLTFDNTFLSMPYAGGFMDVTYAPGTIFSHKDNILSSLNWDNNFNAFAKVDGDSFSEGFGLANQDQIWYKKTTTARGFSVSANGVSGIELKDAWRGNPAGFGQSQLFNFVEYGTNDYRLRGMPALESYGNFLLGYLIARQGTFIRAQNMNRNSDWTNDEIQFQTNVGLRTTVNNSPLSYSIGGTSIYAVVNYEKDGDAQYTVTIDGVLKGTFTANSAQLSGYPTPPNDEINSNYYPFTHRFEVDKGFHNVVIQKVGGTTPLRVSFIQSNLNLPLASGFNGRNFIVIKPFRQKNTTDPTKGYPLWGGSDAIVKAYGDKVDDICTILAKDGYNVLADEGKRTEPNDESNIQNDYLHYSEKGHANIATDQLENVNPISIRYRQLVNDVVRKKNDFTAFDSIKLRADDGVIINLRATKEGNDYTLTLTPEL